MCRYALACFLTLMLLGCATNQLSNARYWKLGVCSEAKNAHIRFAKSDGTTLATVPKEACARIQTALDKLQGQANYRIDELYFVDSDGVNAFATRDKNNNAIVVVTIEMLKTLGIDEDAWAGLIGHEIAHLVKRHGEGRDSAKNAATSSGQVIANILSGLIPGVGGAVAGTVGGTIAQNAMYGAYTRPQEAEADQLGLDWMVAAGYDAQGLVRLFDILGKQSSLPAFISTHPGADDRAKMVKDFVASNARKTNSSIDQNAKLSVLLGLWQGMTKSAISGIAIPAELQIGSGGSLIYKNSYGTELVGTFKLNGNALTGTGNLKIPEQHRGQRLATFPDGTREAIIVLNGTLLSDTRIQGSYIGGGDSGTIEFSKP